MRQKLRLFTRILFFAPLCAFCLCSFAQPARLVYYDIATPESYSSVYTWCLFQDSRGIIWIGTARGLDRWDGSHLQKFSHEPFNPDALPAPNITSITEDNNHNLWLGTGDVNRLIKFDLKTEKFTLIPVPTDSFNFHYTQVLWDPAGFIWVGTFYGLFRYYPETDSLVHVSVQKPDFVKDTHDIGSITRDRNGGIWVTDFYMHLYYWDREQDLLIPQWHLDEMLPHRFAHAYKLTMDASGDLVILGPRCELLKLNTATKTIKLIKPAELYQSAASDGGLAVDHQGNIWYGKGHGLMHFNSADKQVTELETAGIPEIIKDILCDRQGNILVATDNGLKLVNRKASNVKLYSTTKDFFLDDGLWINNIVRSDDQLWLGTYIAGLIRYNIKEGTIKNYRKEESGLPSDFIYTIIRDKNNEIWIISDRSLLHYDPARDHFELINSNTSPFITTDDKGYFWYCWFDHLMRFDPVTHDTVRFPFKNRLDKIHTRTDFFACTIDRKGIFWLGGTFGLTRIDPNTGEWKRYEFQRNNPQSLPNNQVNAVYSDNRGRLWAGTSVGLFRILYDETSGKFSHQAVEYYGRDLGYIYEITGDKQGNTWIASQFGLYVVSSEGNLEYYSSEDGLPQYPGYIRALNVDSDGTLYAGTYEFVAINCDFLEYDGFVPDILITGFKINGSSIQIKGNNAKSIQFSDRIILNHNQNSITVEFSALDFSDPERNRYRYILEGIDQDTIESENKSYADYNGLPPGNYRFWATGSGSSGKWNPNGASLMIRIRPPWQRSTLALLIYGLLFITSILAIIRLRTISLNRDKQRLEKEVSVRTEEIRLKNEQITKLDSLKTRFFTNISHEFRTLATLISLPARALLDDLDIKSYLRSNLELIHHNSHKLIRLVNQLLDISKIDSGMMKISLVHSDIIEFVRTVAISFHSIAESKEIAFEIRLPSGNLVHWYDPDKLEKIITNLLSNAFKYTNRNGKVTISLQEVIPEKGQCDTVQITVSDTGCGISPEDKNRIFERFYQADTHLNRSGGTGIGLSLVLELIHLMHGTIHVDSEPGIGSTFAIKIPLGREHLSRNEYILVTGKDESTDSAQKVIRAEEPDLKPVLKKTEKSPDSRLPLVLIVDDHPEIRTLISNLLKDEFRIQEAENGKEGLEVSQKLYPDLVIADLMMPVMDGVEMCRKMKSDINTSHIPILMLTARAALENRMMGFEAGADDYLSKPFEAQEVIVRVRNLIEQRRRLRDKYGRYYFQDEFNDPALTSIDQKFLKKVIKLTEAHLNDENYEITSLCKELNMSHSTLLRKLQAITGLSPVEFMRNLRLKKAAILLKSDFGNISEIALEVGFSNPSYFAKMFREMFNQSPREYMKDR